ncbi:hypothetical protein [Legionella spiritensis]|uniref:hypothetical protein n=1 Tax=Legionella spiritensis TaxID=452 RepID=UPI000F6F45F9|nr:hypothetical protein [Legionella spiritensis]VEG90071.1 IncA protein [Legionella spiritensis]
MPDSIVKKNASDLSDEQLLNLAKYVESITGKMTEVDLVKGQSWRLSEAIDINNKAVKAAFQDQLNAIDSELVPYTKEHKQINALQNKKLNEKDDGKIKKIDADITKVEQRIAQKKTTRKKEVIAQQTLDIIKEAGAGEALCDELAKRGQPERYLEPVIQAGTRAGTVFGFLLGYQLLLPVLGIVALTTPVGIGITAAVVGSLAIGGIALGIRKGINNYRSLRNKEEANMLKLRIGYIKEKITGKQADTLQNTLENKEKQVKESEKDFVEKFNKTFAQQLDSDKGLDDNNSNIITGILEEKIRDNKSHNIDASHYEKMKNTLSNYQSKNIQKPAPEKTQYNRVPATWTSAFNKVRKVGENLLVGSTFAGVAFGVISILTLAVPGLNIATGVAAGIYLGTVIGGLGITNFVRTLQQKNNDDVTGKLAEHTNNINNTNADLKWENGELTRLDAQKQTLAFMTDQLDTIDDKSSEEDKLIQQADQEEMLRQREEELSSREKELLQREERFKKTKMKLFNAHSESEPQSGGNVAEIQDEIKNKLQDLKESAKSSELDVNFFKPPRSRSFSM